MAATLDLLKVRISDLTGLQLRTIERVIGVPISRLDERPSDLDFAAAIRSAIEGGAVDEYLAFPGKKLIDSVELLSEDRSDPGNA